MSSLFGRGGGGGPARGTPFSIDDAFDIPEDDEAEVSDREVRVGNQPRGVNGRGATQADVPPVITVHADRSVVIINGQHRLHSPGGAEPETGSQDSASLIQSETKPESGYYEGPSSFKHWWLHPKIREKYKLVLFAVALCILGIGLVTGGIVLFSISLGGVQAAVFVIAGIICFLPGAYHLVYIYLAVKGKRGFDFNHLPLFNS